MSDEYLHNELMFSWNLLHRGVKAIFFVQIVNRLGDFVIPFLTLILTQIQGLSPAVAGLVVTVATGLGSLGGLTAGRFSDQFSRRNVLVVFLGTSGTLLAVAGFSPASSLALGCMLASGFFIGAMRPTMGALVADLTAPELRRSAFSLTYLGVNIGVSLGPLLAGWLFNHALSWLFWIDALSTAAAVVVLLRYVPRNTKPEVLETSSSPPSSLKAFLRHPVLLAFSLLVLVYNFVYSQTIFTLALQLVELFGAQGPAIYGVVWAVNAVTVLALTTASLRLTKNWTNLTSMAVAMVFYAVGLAVYLVRPDLGLVIVSTVLWTAGEVLFSIHFGDLVTSQSPPEFRGRFQGYVAFLGSLGFVAAPLTSGLVAQVVGLNGVWWLTVGLVALVGVGFAILARRAPR